MQLSPPSEEREVGTVWCLSRPTADANTMTNAVIRANGNSEIVDNVRDVQGSYLELLPHSKFYSCFEASTTSSNYLCIKRFEHATCTARRCSHKRPSHIYYLVFFCLLIISFLFHDVAARRKKKTRGLSRKAARVYDFVMKRLEVKELDCVRPAYLLEIQEKVL